MPAGGGVQLRKLHPRIVQRTEGRIRELGGQLERDLMTDLLTVNGEFTLSIVLSRCQTLQSGARRWKIRLDTGLAPDITVAVRLDQANEAALDYYIVPWIDLGGKNLRLNDTNGADLDGYRFEGLDLLFEMACRASVRRAA